jgi:hypothetical protein
MNLGRSIPTLALLGAVTLGAGCGARTAEVSSDAPPTAARAIPTEADFHGTYDVFFGGGAGGGVAHDEAPALTAVWTAGNLVVGQDANTMIRTDISIAPATPESGEIRIWDESSSDPMCAAEGVYDYADDGRTITMTVQSDPCPNRRASADGARMVRRG